MGTFEVSAGVVRLLDPSVEPTMDEYIKAQREAEQQQSDACVEELRSIYLRNNTATAESQEDFLRRRRSMMIFKGEGAVAKISKSGLVFKGWRAPAAQQKGRPRKLHPARESYLRQFDDWARAQLEHFGSSAKASILGRRSGAARSKNSLAQKIVDRNEALCRRGVSKHERASRVARALGCNANYVREVLRAQRTQ